MNEILSRLNSVVSEAANVQVPLTTILVILTVAYFAKRAIWFIPRLALGWVTGLLRLIPNHKALTVVGYIIGGFMAVGGMVVAGSAINFSSQFGVPDPTDVYEKARYTSDRQTATEMIQSADKIWERQQTINDTRTPEQRLSAAESKSSEKLGIVPGLPRGGAIFGGIMTTILGVLLLFRTGFRDHSSASDEDNT